MKDPEISWLLQDQMILFMLIQVSLSVFFFFDECSWTQSFEIMMCFVTAGVDPLLDLKLP